MAKNLRIKQAILQAELNGKEIDKKVLSQKLWPDSTVESQQVNMSNLMSNKTKKINPEWINILCEELGCSSDFLFGIKDE